MAEAAVVTRHDFTTVTFARTQNSECSVKPPFLATLGGQKLSIHSYKNLLYLDMQYVPVLWQLNQVAIGYQLSAVGYQPETKSLRYRCAHTTLALDPRPLTPLSSTYDLPLTPFSLYFCSRQQWTLNSQQWT